MGSPNAPGTSTSFLASSDSCVGSAVRCPLTTTSVALGSKEGLGAVVSAIAWRGSVALKTHTSVCLIIVPDDSGTTLCERYEQLRHTANSTPASTRILGKRFQGSRATAAEHLPILQHW